MGRRGDPGEIQGRSIDLVGVRCSGVSEEKEVGNEVEIRVTSVRTSEEESFGCLVGAMRGFEGNVEGD